MAQVDGAIPSQTCSIQPEAAEPESWLKAVVLTFNSIIT